jgi:hypothetical protein
MPQAEAAHNAEPINVLTRSRGIVKKTRTAMTAMTPRPFSLDCRWIRSVGAPALDSADGFTASPTH